MKNDVDGNLAALRQHERENDAQETSREALFERLKPQLNQIEHLISECQIEAEDNLYDFTDEVKNKILSFF